jgi:aconitate hydratase
MGVLPLQYEPGSTAESLGLTGAETLAVAGLGGELTPRQRIAVTATRTDGSTFRFDCIVRLDTPLDVEYFKNGGILQTVLRSLVT